jgi:hypothetical protein
VPEPVPEQVPELELEREQEQLMIYGNTKPLSKSGASLNPLKAFRWNWDRLPERSKSRSRRWSLNRSWSESRLGSGNPGRGKSWSQSQSGGWLWSRHSRHNNREQNP